MSKIVPHIRRVKSLTDFDSVDTLESTRSQRERLAAHFALVFTPVWLGMAFYQAVNGMWLYSAANFVLVAIVLTVLVLLRATRREAAVNLAFWGSAATLAVAWTFSVVEGDIAQDSAMVMIASMATISVLLAGLYSVRMYQIDVMFAIALFANALWFFRDRYDIARWIHFFVAYAAILLLSFVAARFEFRLSRKAERQFAAIRLLNRQLEQLRYSESRARAEMENCIARFGHDVRSPLTASLNVTSLLLTSGLSKEQQDYVRMLQNSQKAVIQLVEHGIPTCHASRDTGHDVQSIHLGSFLENIVELHSVCRTRANSRIDLHVSERLPRIDVALSDLTRVMDNLIENALKYTHNGRVVVTGKVTQSDEELDRLELIISVRDTGIGMSEARLEEVRKGTNGPDPRVESSRGIGISSCREIIRSAGGTLVINSREAKGTEVIARIPVTRSETSHTSIDVPG